MKLMFSLFLLFNILITSFPGVQLLLDYRINKKYYLKYCENKTKPDLKCLGKCQVKKQLKDNSFLSKIIKVCCEGAFIVHDLAYVYKSRKFYSTKNKFSKLVTSASENCLDVLSPPPDSFFTAR